MSTSKLKPEKNETRERSARRSNWLSEIIHFDPVGAVADAWDAFDMWRATRRWTPLLLGIPSTLLFLIVAIPVLVGWVFLEGSTRKAYGEKAREMDPIDLLSARKGERKGNQGSSVSLLDDAKEEENKEALTEEELKKKKEKELRNARFADLLYSRILQMQSSNKDATFRVAARLVARGEIDKARSMMQQLAPEDVQGFAPAHAWLAWDLKNRFIAGEKIDLSLFEHHMVASSDFQGSSEWASVLVFYARKLESDNKLSEAINMLERAASIEPQLRLILSSFLGNHGQPIRAREEADQAAAYFSEFLGTRDELDINRILVAQARLQAKRYDDAIKILAEGLKIRPDRPQLKRAMSEVYRQQFIDDLRESQKGQEAKVKLGLLNAAIIADPTNPRIGDQIMYLKNAGVTVDENMIAHLRETLASGGATAITHLLLGNAYFDQKERNITKAMTHWQLAMGQDPNMVLALNNLAVAMSYLDPPKTEEALKLIDRAIELTNGHPEFHDSRGEILHRAGRYEEAIVDFEKALVRDPYRLATREKLYRSYKDAGLEDLAEAQLTTIGKIRDQQKARGANIDAMMLKPKEFTEAEDKKEEKPKPPPVDPKILEKDLDFLNQKKP